MKTPLSSRVRFALLATAVLLIFGCATNRQSQAPEPRGIIVEGEVIQPTGSRISHVVKKGDPAGIANDMPGTVNGTRDLAHEQNDIAPQFPVGGP